MKKELRRKLLYLIYELESLSIDGTDTEKALAAAFEMLQILIDEETFTVVKDMWNNRASTSDKENLTIGLMQFDREVRLLLIEKKLI